MCPQRMTRSFRNVKWSFAALWMVKRMDGSVRRNIVEPVVMPAGQADRIGENDRPCGWRGVVCLAAETLFQRRTLTAPGL